MVDILDEDNFPNERLERARAAFPERSRYVNHVPRTIQRDFSINSKELIEPGNSAIVFETAERIFRPEIFSGSPETLMNFFIIAIFVGTIKHDVREIAVLLRNYQIKPLRPGVNLSMAVQNIGTIPRKFEGVWRGTALIE